MPTTGSMKEKMVPVDVMRDLTRGSFEHLSQRIKLAVSENRELFSDKRSVQVDSIATFPGYVLVGTAEGNYYRSKYEDVDGNIRLAVPEKIDVPVVDAGNAKQFSRQYAMGVVDSILSGTKEESVERVLAYLDLTESVNTTPPGIADIVFEHVRQARPWRSLYNEQKQEIVGSLKEAAEVLRSQKISPKYAPLYDGTIPEEKFENYRSEVVNNLSVASERLERAQTKAEMVYYPFFESLQNTTRTPEEDQVLGQFSSFAEDFFEDIQDLREYVSNGLKNEQCVMCLGQVHDAVAESLTDYEIAGTFVERMVVDLRDAK